MFQIGSEMVRRDRPMTQTAKRLPLAASLAQQIADHLQVQGLTEGTPVRAQALADLFKVSRTPINDALKLLATAGVLRHEANRGYFVGPEASTSIRNLPTPEGPDLNELYYRIADDRLQGLLPEQLSQHTLRQRYNLTPSQLHTLIERMSAEGWLERLPGYGLAFSPVLATPEMLDQTYRFRAVLEPGCLLEPGYALKPAELQRLRAAEENLLGGGLDTMSLDELYEIRAQFHEVLVAASGNIFFIDALRRVNQMRRLLAYRSMRDRDRYVQQAQEHLAILDCLERGENVRAAELLAEHLGRVAERWRLSPLTWKS